MRQFRHMALFLLLLIMAAIAGCKTRERAAEPTEPDYTMGYTLGSSVEPITRLPKLQWPPFPPSASYEFPRSLFARVTTMSGAAELLEARFRRCRFESWRYFEIPGGFALVTRMERIDQTGAPLSDDKRWCLSDEAIFFPGPNFVREYLHRLFTDERTPGLFRVFVFMVTHSPIITNGNELTFEQANQLNIEGIDRLPSNMSGDTLAAGTRCTALIYEFRGSVELPEFIHPSRVGGRTHLLKSGLIGRDE